MCVCGLLSFINRGHYDAERQKGTTAKTLALGNSCSLAKNFGMMDQGAGWHRDPPCFPLGCRTFAALASQCGHLDTKLFVSSRGKKMSVWRLMKGCARSEGALPKEGSQGGQKGPRRCARARARVCIFQKLNAWGGCAEDGC